EISWEQRKHGNPQANSAMRAGFSAWMANRLERQRKGILLNPMTSAAMPTPDDPVSVHDLGPEARRALEDFGFFQRRYFGRIAYPWQVQAAEMVVELLASPYKE